MTDSRFWEIVDFVDWPREDYKDVKVDLLMNMAPNEIDEFRDELGKRTSELREKFDEAYDEANADFYVSGDGLDDLVNHVVGLGKAFYKDHVEYPETLLSDYKGNNFVESFSYAIPRPTDYEKLGTGYYQFRSTKYVESYKKIAENEKFSEDYRYKASRMASALEDFPSLSGVARRWKYADLIEEATQEALLDRMYEIEEELSDDINGWPARNLISDYRTYYIYNN